MLTDEQVKLFRKERMKGKKQEAAAAAAGICVRTARRWDTGPLPSQRKEGRTWRTRKDPFSEVWNDEVVPLLKSDKARKLQAKSVLNELRRRHPGEYPKSLLRTLQRRMRDWRALHGSAKEVVFPQQHPPGREAAFDFTHADELGVTIAGDNFDHLLFTMKASCGKWMYAEVAFGETWEAMCRGLQNAMWEASGVFQIWRHDNLSAATQELKRSAGRTLTKRYQDLLDHYNAKSTRIKPGKAWENGVAEKANHLLKTALDQELRLRGHRDFATVGAYTDFVREVVAAHNDEHARTIESSCRSRAAVCPTTRCTTPRFVAGAPFASPGAAIRCHPDSSATKSRYGNTRTTSKSSSRASSRWSCLDCAVQRIFGSITDM